MAKSAGRFLILHLILPDQSIVDNTHFIFEVDGIMPLCSNGSETNRLGFTMNSPESIIPLGIIWATKSKRLQQHKVR